MCVQIFDHNISSRSAKSKKNGQIIRPNQREKAKKRKSSKKFEDYRWTELIMKGKLDSLKVSELDKYLDNFKLKRN